MAEVLSISGLVADWRVTSDGRLRDAVTGAYATITGNGGVLPNVRPWGDVYPGGRGLVADFTAAVGVTVPATAWDKTKGTLVAVVGPLAAPATGGSWVAWRPDGTNKIELYGLGGAKGTVRAAVVAGAVNYESSSAWDDGPACVAAMTWQVGQPVVAYRDGAAGAPSAATTAPVGDLAVARIGTRAAGLLPANGPIARVLVFDRVLAATEVAALQPLLAGPPRRRGFLALLRR